LDAVRSAVKRLEGAYAIGVIHKDDPTRIIATRAGSPLVVGKGIGENFIASDVLALKPVTDRFIFLEEGDLVEIRADSISVWNVDDESVVRSDVRVEMGHDDIDKGNYRHHMQKEIFEQPKVLKDTLEGRIGRTQVLEQAFGVNANKVFEGVDGVTLVACGTSYYAASIARYWVEELVGIPCQVEIASEFRYRKLAVLPNQLFVSISQSGETADTLAALRIAKDVGFSVTLTICNVPTSSLVRESDLALMIQAGTEVGVASTKAFTAQLADLMLLTILLGRHNGMSRECEAELVGGLHTLDGVVEEALRLDGAIRLVAERFIDRNHALFLGRGTMFPVAMEGALKLKEISYIHAEGYPAGELKHGPLALVDDDMPVIAVAPNDELLEKLHSNLQEVRARGGELLVFADERSGFKDEPGVTVISLPRVSPILAPIVYVVPLQLLAYHVAVLKGTDVDQPRNLAKSVTVE
jgi:glucosamine--fructose-6-phosphate aminotransferase (isomerizing)